ncbi:DUF4905 domain-containing protein [Mucilaginibacter sp.]
MPSPFIHQAFNGIIWRMEIDSLSNTLFLEIRNTEDKQVSFASINLTDGKINFTQLTQPERWLIGIETAYDGILLLHQYQAATSPVHKGVIAVDGTNGTTLWSNYTYAFDSLAQLGPVLYNVQIQPKKLFITDIKTGETLRQFEPLKDAVPYNHIKATDIFPSTSLPPQLKVEPYGNIIHSLYYNNFRIVSLHTVNAGILKQHLYILNDMGIFYEDILNDGIQKMQPESFILYKNCLVYIKNKSEIKVINL